MLQTLLNCQPCWLKIERAMRRIIKTTALALLPLVVGGQARAAENEPKVITLSCDGTLTPTYGANKPEVPQPLQKASVIVNLDEQTVFFFGYVIPIDDVDEASINFGGRQIVDYGFSVAIRGSIDRVTGRMDATTVLSDPTKQPDPNAATIHYDVICEAVAGAILRR
ncbi:MAG: hypothetical protein WA728_05285 [Xanthobacteraceae bacterium]